MRQRTNESVSERAVGAGGWKPTGWQKAHWQQGGWKRAVMDRPKAPRPYSPGGLLWVGLMSGYYRDVLLGEVFIRFCVDVLRGPFGTRV